eukprot:TRINITY_DN442_c0_g1_i1.p1 TRINITY_DN442_c0_g1~~TRINITY_DN442_c0_g1_i1.p1  ORF type:complete len:261 (-),score=54.08 TRINITY_DN442_c0_g1_i1:51-833(-)
MIIMALLSVGKKPLDGNYLWRSYVVVPNYDVNMMGCGQSLMGSVEDYLEEYVSLQSNQLEIYDDDWELFIDIDDNHGTFKCWKKPLDGNYLWRSYVVVPNYDVNMMVNLQRDLEFRREYMENTTDLDILESTETENGYIDSLYWRVKIPFLRFCSEREYCFTRTLQKVGDIYIILDESIEHEEAPTNKKYVRIENYLRVMIIEKYEEDSIQIYTSFAKPIDMKMPIPNWLISWFGTKGLARYRKTIKNALDAYEAHVNSS